LLVVFKGRRKTGRLDLEAIEMAVRSALQQAGEAALSKPLRIAAPTAAESRIPCACGHEAHYRELRIKSVLTAVGKVQVSRPYYLCPHCHTGVRRMQAVVGQEPPFDHGPNAASPLIEAQPR
jgi:hypothetical protein